MSRQELVFVSSGIVCKRLDITHSTLHHLFKHIPHVLIGRMHLFPLSYIDAFAVYLGSRGQRAKTSSAACFWSTEEAQDNCRMAVRQLEEGLDRPTLTGKELAKLTGIAYNTIFSWTHNGVLERKRAWSSGRGEAIVFSGEGLRQAFAWQMPAVPPPPPPPPIFIPPAKTKQVIEQRGRETEGTVASSFGQLRNPGGGSMFPLLYVAVLLKHTEGPLTRQLVTVFNTTSVAKEAMLKTKAEFERRLAVRQQTSPHPDGLLTLPTVAWLLGMNIDAVRRWCDRGHLPYTLVSGDKVVSPAALLARVKWILPTRI